MSAGGGPSDTTSYTAVEEVVLRMMSPVAVTGLPLPDSQGATMSKGNKDKLQLWSMQHKLIPGLWYLHRWGFPH